MSDIQKARDILAKWRDENTSPPWVRRGHHIYSLVTRYEVAENVDVPDAHLIIGTAGNPDLLDAIDGLLELALTYGDLPQGSGSRFITRAERIAAAIIVADEWMTS